MANTLGGVSALELRIRAVAQHAEVEIRCAETKSTVETQLRILIPRRTPPIWA